MKIFRPLFVCLFLLVLAACGAGEKSEPSHDPDT